MARKVRWGVLSTANIATEQVIPATVVDRSAPWRHDSGLLAEQIMQFWHTRRRDRRGKPSHGRDVHPLEAGDIVPVAVL